PPATVASAETVTLTASAAGATGSATITVNPAAAVTVSVSPATKTFTAGTGTQLFTATVTGATGTPTVTWTLSPATGSGTLSATTGASVTYTPPATVASAETVTLTASAAGATGSATITVNPAATYGTPSAFCQAASSLLTTELENCLKVPPEVASSLGNGLVNSASCSSFDTGASKGYFTYSSSAASSCYSGAQSAACGLFESLPPVCDTVLTPLKAVGQACYTGSDCINSYCSADSSTCPGVCTAFLAPNAACGTGSGTCPPGYSCYAVGANAPTCTLESSAGGACPCAEGNYCDTSGASPTCVALKTSGACTASGQECAVGFVCALTTQTSGSCTPFLGVGDTCTPTANACQPEGTYCSTTTGKCTLWPQVGEACGPSTSVVCLNGYCSNPLGGVCTAYVAVGQPCTSPLQCQSFNCASPSNTCAAPPAPCSYQ
ncbi:MAG TPA: hypothetical protein VMU14_06595, partial [Acidimicrobiales bacterium]|nr:hypothetical protein [Acidimicrobiales bacterium]